MDLVGMRSRRRDDEAAASAAGQRIVALDASNDNDLEPAFTVMVQQGADALLVIYGQPIFQQQA
jgi:hypothetical protein